MRGHCFGRTAICGCSENIPAWSDLGEGLASVSHDRKGMYMSDSQSTVRSQQVEEAVEQTLIDSLNKDLTEEEINQLKQRVMTVRQLNTK